jgi:hypothetical protein
MCAEPGSHWKAAAPQNFTGLDILRVEHSLVAAVCVAALDCCIIAGVSAATTAASAAASSLVCTCIA